MRLQTNPYFTFVGEAPYADIDRLLRTSEADAVVVLHTDAGVLSMQIVADRSNTTLAQSAQAYIGSVVSGEDAASSRDSIARAVQSAAEELLQLRARHPRHDIHPHLCHHDVGVHLPALHSIGMIIGRLVYGLVPQGSVGAIYLASFLFSLVMSGLGAAISNCATTILQSIFLMFAFIMVFQLMSGLFTPISSMSQYVTYAVPPRYFIEIMRSVYLKGSAMAELVPQYLALTAIAAVVLSVAAATYRKQA